MNKDYDELKKEILEKASVSTKMIMDKYKVSEKGFLDGEPWAKELKENSKRTLQELQKLKDKYNK